MFSTKSKSEHYSHGIDRFQYLQNLVTEFQDTGKQEYKKQILANLANFGYDPLNYEHFRKLNILDLFLDVLVEEKDESMIEFAMGGICNCCLDKSNQDFLIQNGAIEIVVSHLSSSHEETILSTITTLLFMMTSLSKNDICSQRIVEIMEKYAASPNKRLSNLATVFLEASQST